MQALQRMCRLAGSRSSTTLPIQRSTNAWMSTNLWGHLESAPLDGNHATNAAFEADTFDGKVNLGRGVYKDDKGKNWVLPSVAMAEKKILSSHLGHEYLPFKGLAAFCDATSEFAFGASNPLITEGKVATVQAVSGTGALRVGAEFLSRFLPSGNPRTVYVSQPTYVNHFPIFRNTGFEIKAYRYYDANTNSLDLSGMIADIKNADEGAVFLLHSCAHNPTGIDPSADQWKQISEAIKEKKGVCFFDSAYQGFASGDPDHDAHSFRTFAADGHEVLVAQSYAKNMGLYGQRIGALNVVAADAGQTKNVMSQLNQVIRPMYSNPPLHGARIVSTVFQEADIQKQWTTDVKTMANRIIGSRKALVDNLKALGSTRDWSHITNQIGMFAYSGLSEKEVMALRDNHVYMNLDGRMSISGINSGNVEYLASSMHKATTA
eukprot:TRINITY_DN13025_c0_g1_i1.p1 TRINITY_DN13025_c0_g1~~TRINITY_DN13025_c0_g1_i1.p1  ORF type:complete len:446 (+),score=132.56 TRINITY_DN13025_c0_g1_i1:39-1340(+)